MIQYIRVLGSDTLSHGMLESGLSGSQENIIFISKKDVGVTIILSVPTVGW